MKQRVVIVIFAVVVLLMIVFGTNMNQATDNTGFVTQQVIRGEINLLVSASGNVNPENIYNVNPRLNSKILEINVKMGEMVIAGQQLARLDDTDLQNAVKSAEYSFNAAVYTRDQLKNAPIVDDYSVKKAQQQVNSAYVQVQQAKNNLNNAKLISPIAGKVLAVNIKQDEFASVTAMQPAFVIGSSDVLRAYLNVNEIDIVKVALGQKVLLTIDAVGNTISGEVVSIAESSTNAAGIITYMVQSSISDISNLKPGMSVDADVVINSKSDVLIIPAAAVQSKDGKTIVRVLERSEGEVILEKDVELGINNNTWVEVVSGLAEGEAVIINYNVATKSSGSPFGLQ